MEIKASDVMKLRQMTGVSMMECKKALQKTEGDCEAAVKLLRELGQATSAKRADKATKEGLVFAKASADGAKVALVEVNCETDFVANAEDFKAFTEKVADLALAGEKDLTAATAEAHETIVAKLGEKIEIRRSDVMDLSGTGKLASYIHMGGKIGVIAEVGCDNAATLDNPEFQQLVKDLCLQICASAPKWLERAQVPADVIASEMEINRKKIEAEQAEKGGKPKPAEILEKIAQGQLNKFYQENCLLEQAFWKNEPGQKTTVTQLMDTVCKKVNDKVVLRRYIRYTRGA